jgi:hypothetical protein
MKKTLSKGQMANVNESFKKIRMKDRKKVFRNDIIASYKHMMPSLKQRT